MQNIRRAIELKAELDTLRPLTKEQELKIMQKFRLDWNYHSNHLEGNSLTFGETKNLILHGITAQGKPLKDHFEITGHNEAINWVLDVVKGDAPLTEKFIRELHVLLLKESYESAAITPDGTPTVKRIEIGKYKSTPNHVKTSTGEIFRFAEPEETPALMMDLLNWYQSKSAEADLNVVLLASEFHYRFIRIHPFDDGNGRTVRILMNFILMRFGYPPVIIKSEDKINYFGALRQADVGDFEAFADYIGKNLVRSLEIMIAGAKGESIEEPDDLDKSIALLDQRFKNVGKKAEIFRSKTTIISLFKNQLKLTIIEFIETCSKFNRFYIRNNMSLSIDYKTYLFQKANFYGVLDEKISNNCSRINFTYQFQILNNSSLEPTNYDSTIYFRFGEYKYTIICGDVKITKYYDEEITPIELKMILKEIGNLHQIFIELHIKKAEDSKNKNK